MKKLWRKIKFWYWWKFQATEIDKYFYDALVGGTGLIKNGKRIDPKDFYIN